MPSVIYKVTIVWNFREDGSKFCLFKQVEEVKLPQPIGVRFTQTITRGTGWEEYVYWFWNMEHADDCLMNTPAREGKPNYNRPPIEPEVLKERIQSAAKELQRLKRNRTAEKRQCLVLKYSPAYAVIV